MRNATIPITDHSNQCVSSYKVEYKLTGEPYGWTLLPDWVGAPPIIIYNLEEASYDVRITRVCCNGQYGEPKEFTIDSDVPALDPPANFVVTGFVGGSEAVWDNDTDADTYIVERDTNSGFPTPVEVYNGAYTAMVSDSPLAAGTYYYRIKAQGSGFADSSYSYDSAIVT